MFKSEFMNRQVFYCYMKRVCRHTLFFWSFLRFSA